ncbi:MAG: response regulator/pilus assembly protein [Chloroflexi bacterium]|nr:response regulator/pilus assembly protein [Chloroflexota bacterium]
MPLMEYETIRILLISAHESMRDQVQSILQGRLANHRIYWVSQSDLGLRRTEELMPHLILVNTDLPATPMSYFVRELGSRAPGVPIFVLIEPDALSEASQAVLAGARGFITKPLRPDDLVSSIQEVLRQRQAPQEDKPAQPMGRVIVFCAPKGGTGRTTLAVNTAVGLAQKAGESVVMIDADLAAPALDVALNLQSARTIANLLPRLSRLDEELVRGVLARHASGVQVLLAPPPGVLPQSIPLPQVQQIVATLRRTFAWVIVDLGLPMNETAYAFLDAADRIVLSILPEMVGLRNTRLMLGQLYERGYPEGKIWLVVNRATLAGGVKPKDIEGHLDISVAFTIPDDQPLATHAINRGVPAILSHRRSALARGYRQFVQKIIAELPPTDQEGRLRHAARASLVERLLGKQPVRQWRARPKKADGLRAASTVEGNDG